MSGWPGDGEDLGGDVEAALEEEMAAASRAADGGEGGDLPP